MMGIKNIKPALMTYASALPLVLFMCICLAGAPAYAACLSGVPCVVGKTPNNPSNPGDGPNAAGAPNAKKTSSGACDADFMNQIYARATLEAQRENVMSQVTIRKPDSVLEYTCFDTVVSNAASAGGLFSNATGNLGNALNGLVRNALTAYTSTNFGHSFLGGVASANQPCPRMNSIYTLAKCGDFGVDDPFLTFQNLAAFDPRSLPSACSGGPPLQTNMIDVAQSTGTSFTYANFDAMANNYLDRLLIAPGGGNCYNPAIPTGRIINFARKSADSMGNVIVTATHSYEEHVCPNPGCYYSICSNSACTSFISPGQCKAN